MASRAGKDVQVDISGVNGNALQGLLAMGFEDGHGRAVGSSPEEQPALRMRSGRFSARLSSCGSTAAQTD